ncbi:MAG: DUF1488 domain-containing protein [Rhizobiales bacterium]|nr:DUF1488 domain-containing protein [Hyphomicrobiales bacterium]MBI3674692.1 DUF1488 domain-containing protein [Hyphomicrobiales bacterium]
MTIEFPNPSRRYDATRHCVRFSGYDGALERPFFVEEDVIRRLAGSALAGESGLLEAFDRHRDRICKVAEMVYGRRREGSYTLTHTDFA